MAYASEVSSALTFEGASSPEDYSGYRVVAARHPWRIAGSVLAVFAVAITFHSILTNPRWGWDVFARFFFSEPVLVGLGRTLLLTVLASALGFLLGGILAFGRVSKSPLLSGVSCADIWFLRCIPLIVLRLVLNNP